LREQGIDPQRLLACGSGEYRPRVPNDSDANRVKNRRIEIFAVNPW
jgi:chemotaxis protein MotB